MRKIIWERFKPITLKDKSVMFFKNLLDFFSKIPTWVKWVLSVIVGGFIYKISEFIVFNYFEVEALSLDDVIYLLRLQFVMDIFIIILLSLVILAVIYLYRRS